MIIREIEEELATARESFVGFHSMHEGYAVILEELEELFDAVRMKDGHPLRKAMARREAIQVAAMAIRFIEDCCEE